MTEAEFPIGERPIAGPWRTAVEYLLIVAGAGLVALSLTMFLLPNNVVAGGVTGLAVIAELSLKIPLGAALLVFNVPLLVLQWRLLGGPAVFARTLVGVLALAVLTEVLRPMVEPVTDDRLLIICYGGGLSGLGLAMVFHGRGTTGGADILARLCNRYLGWSIGRTLLGFNVVIYGLAAQLYGPEPAMVALLMAYVLARVLDTVLHGLASSRAVMIVTDKPNDVREAVIKVMARGLTILPAIGGHTGRKKSLLYVVVPRGDIQRLKLRVMDKDPTAFITVLTPREAVGGFHLAKPQ